jgi:enoyl-CoA hydratase/carnithine racemase
MNLAAMTGHIQTDYQDGVLGIRFNRPEKKNALNLAMYTSLADALTYADEEDAVRVVLLAGSEGCFTSGNDLADFLNSPLTGNESPGMKFLAAISQARKPIVAAVSGAAIGIGVTMLLHCDLVYAGASARFQMPFVNLGLCPEAGSTLLLPKIMGYQRAAELILLGEPFGAETARELGIVNAVYSDEDLLETAQAKARQLATKPAAAVRLSKALLKREYLDSLRETMAEEMVHFIACLKSPEAAEALQAFLEKREPDFRRFS